MSACTSKIPRPSEECTYRGAGAVTTVSHNELLRLAVDSFAWGQETEEAIHLADPAVMWTTRRGSEIAAATG